ncbi:MAG: hypothetical protein K8R91_00875, partial [Phycisphaerae bacterium]|nr:hypothetical protein [Phycisphaerae bacterium]
LVDYLQAVKNGINQGYKPVTLVFGCILNAVALDPASCPDQQFTTHASGFQFDGKIIRLARLMLTLNVCQDVFVYRNPEQIIDPGALKMSAQIIFDFFEIGRS